jgi:hypothetical protein
MTPLLRKQPAHSTAENMSVRSGDNCLTGIIRWATIRHHNPNLSYFFAEEGAILLS